jgi:hypothetical protein
VQPPTDPKTISISEIVLEKIRIIIQRKSEHNQQCESSGRGTRIMQIATFKELQERLEIKRESLDLVMLRLVREGKVHPMNQGFYL